MIRYGREVVLCWFLLGCVISHAQESSDNLIEVSFDKTVMLYFSDSVSYMNCGNKDMVGVTRKSNKVLVRAMEEYFEETNLIVELANGELYDFILKYNNNTKKFIYKIKGKAENSTSFVMQDDAHSSSSGSSVPKITPNKVAVLDNKVKNEAVNTTRPSNACMTFVNATDYLKGIAQLLDGSKTILKVGGIWVINDKFFFQIRLINKTTIDYEIKHVQFLIKNLPKGLKKKASPVTDPVKILSQCNTENTIVKANSTSVFVYVFKKFTIAVDKGFYINITEKNGERNFDLPVESKDIINAKTAYENN